MCFLNLSRPQTVQPRGRVQLLTHVPIRINRRAAGAKGEQLAEGSIRVGVGIKLMVGLVTLLHNPRVLPCPSCRKYLVVKVKVSF